MSQSSAYKSDDYIECLGDEACEVSQMMTLKVLVIKLDMMKTRWIIEAVGQQAMESCLQDKDISKFLV